MFSVNLQKRAIKKEVLFVDKIDLLIYMCGAVKK